MNHSVSLFGSRKRNHNAKSKLREETTKNVDGSPSSTKSGQQQQHVILGIPDPYSSSQEFVEDLERPPPQPKAGDNSIDIDNNITMDNCDDNVSLSHYHDHQSPPGTTTTTTTGSMSWAPRQGNQKRILMVLILVLGAAASAAFLSIGIVGAHKEMQNEFETDAHDLANAIRSAWDDYRMFSLWIHESCHLVDASDGQTYNHLLLDNNNNDTTITITTQTGFCSREKFQHLYEYIQSVGLEFVAMQYIPNVTHAERSYLEEEARQFHAHRNPNMTYVGIKELELSPTDGSVVSLGPSPAKPWYFPMHFLLPLERNENAVDIDLYSYRSTEIDTAFATWQPVMGTRARLFQDPDPRVYGIEFIHPGIYTTSDQHDNRRTGLSKVVIKLPALMERAARDFLKDCRVYVFDVSHYPLQEPVFLVGANLVQERVVLTDEIVYQDIPSASKTFRESITIMDKKWQVVVQPHGDLYEEQLEHVILGGVLMFVACIIIVVWFHTHMDRLTRENHIKSKAQAEKSQLAFDQVKRERHLNDFIAHEVRNPLSSAMAALSFVLSTAQERVTDPEVREALLDDIGIVDGSLDYINDLLKNMLDIHKSACNEMKLDITTTCILEEIFEPVSKILVPRCGTIQIILDCNPPNLYANIDRLRMKQVILNLTINATKFVDKGFIRLRAEVVDGKTCIFVEDSGPGIPEQKRNRLFEKFQESLDLRNQGTGIGLYVCKNLTKLMGGSIYLDEAYHSEVPDCPGACFVIDLQQDPIYKSPTSFSSSSIDGQDEEAGNEGSATPSTFDETHAGSEEFGCDCAGLSSTPNDTLAPTSISSTMTTVNGQHCSHKHHCASALPEKLTVLFVDDDAVLRKLFARSMSRVRPGWSIEQAPYGEEALKLVEKKQYDIIFIDQYMAGDEKMLLGTETVVMLRNEKKVTSLICGLSANDMREQFTDAGADAFMMKPFPCEKKALERELIRVWNGKNSSC